MSKKITSDGEFIKKHLNEFLHTKNAHYSKKLCYLASDDSESVVNGWEKWLQFELLFYMVNHPDFCDPKKEDRYDLDRRKSDKTTMLVDLTFKRIANETESNPVFLELKRSKFIARLVEKMIGDAVKLQSIKKSENDSRTCWLLGFTPFPGDDSSFNIALEKAKPDFYSCLNSANSQVFTFGNHGIILYGFEIP